MNDQLTLLIQLQDIDARIRTHNNAKERIPAQIALLETRSATNQEQIDKAREALETAQKAKRDRDGDLEEGGRKVEKLKSKTTEIKTNKEYTALLKEIETAEQENKAIEDDILKLMEKIDAAANEIKTAEARAAEESSSIQEERKQLEANMAAVDEALAAEDRSRSELAARIEHQVLVEYQRLLGSGNGRAIVEARGESCSGCYMSIPPQLFVNVKRNENIIFCPNCHRILYYKETITPKGV
jgi:predicted  nucleic acid-binding Zn-ribbon protein